MVPVYAWASALKLLLPGPQFTIERQLLDASKECYEVCAYLIPLYLILILRLRIHHFRCKRLKIRAFCNLSVILSTPKRTINYRSTLYALLA